MFFVHTTNEVWGTAHNPWNYERSCAGSSGGDGALVGGRCVPLSFGSDIGGSIRLPSSFNGAAGFKPTSTRVSDLGASGPSRTRAKN